MSFTHLLPSVSSPFHLSLWSNDFIIRMSVPAEVKWLSFTYNDIMGGGLDEIDTMSN